jgi:transposase-like protein
MAANLRKKAEDKLLLALACGATVESAARECGISPRTVYRRLTDPRFRRRLQALRGDMVQRTAGTLTAASSEAVRTLLELLKPAVAANTRLGAARAVLESGVKLRELAEFEERLAALEEQMQTQQESA